MAVAEGLIVRSVHSERVQGTQIIRSSLTSAAQDAFRKRAALRGLRLQMTDSSPKWLRCRPSSKPVGAKNAIESCAKTGY